MSTTDGSSLEDVDLTALVRDVSAALDAELRAAGCELALEVPTHCWGVWDRARLEQIVSELLRSAMLRGARRPIDVSVGVDPEQIELAVKDRGDRLPPQDQQRVFEQGEGMPPGAASAPGRGLPAVRQNALAMGGHVSVRSNPADGTELVVVLPRVTEEALT